MGFIEEDRAKIWKEHMEKIMNEENEWEHMMETDLVEGPGEKVACNEIVEAIQSKKSGTATGTSEVSVGMIVACGEIGVKVMMCMDASVYRMVKEYICMYIYVNIFLLSKVFSHVILL